MAHTASVKTKLNVNENCKIVYWCKIVTKNFQLTLYLQKFDIFCILPHNNHNNNGKNNAAFEIFKTLLPFDFSAEFLTFNDQCSHHIETGQLICRANQLTGFYMMRTLVVKRLKYQSITHDSWHWTQIECTQIEYTLRRHQGMSIYVQFTPCVQGARLNDVKSSGWEDYVLQVDYCL